MTVGDLLRALKNEDPEAIVLSYVYVKDLAPAELQQVGSFDREVSSKDRNVVILKPAL